MVIACNSAMELSIHIEVLMANSSVASRAASAGTSKRSISAASRVAATAPHAAEYREAPAAGGTPTRRKPLTKSDPSAVYCG
jgi:hypothetical protein